MTDEPDVKIPTKEELLNEEGQTAPEQGKTPTQEVTYTALELEALKQGWKPKDKWEGDPEQHRSAREYLDRGELLGKIKSQNTQLDEIKKALGAMSEQNKKVHQAGYEQALKDLRAQRAAAMREGDFETVEQLEEKIDEHKEVIREIKHQPAQLPGPSATTQEWLSENPWYAKDRIMRKVADELAVEYVQSHPRASEEAIYEYIDKKIRTELPDKFKKQTTSAPDPDGESRQVVRGKQSAFSSFDKLLDGMTDDQRNIAKTLVKTGAITKEEYVKQYNQMMGG
jgi:hypothetical protein